ncbi:acylphosphatase [Sphingobium sp. WTD-1]|uniref:acylphosphatase n=1 Tax=Sphingobium sp. WTD-1 TaxID=2979467 RepID=UPI0024DE1980|nr:acylphosphatase [Sphingobium sp. WTD-1]WIA54484.1 acylphosphatase [Sphingobium sp. WTD-1]
MVSSACPIWSPPSPISPPKCAKAARPGSSVSADVGQRPPSDDPGLVQRVFYRNWTVDTVCSLVSAGWVGNRMDRSAELSVQDEGASVSDLLPWCRTGRSLC